MTTLMPRGYGGFPSYQFSPPNQINFGYYNSGYPRQGVSFAPHYPTQPLYQPPFNPSNRRAALTVDQFRQPGLGTQVATLFNELDARYRQEQHLRQLQKMQKRYWKQQANNMPPPLYPARPPMNYSPGVVYQYEKETKYVPYPVYIRPGAGVYGAGGHFGTAPGSSMTLGLGGSASLPPKIRVIFIPTGQSSSQQQCAGSLAMPPFLYNRMSQPFCSLPLPPPLPQLGAMPLTPAVQQMVIQRYSNPVAVLPFAPNCQIPQMMIPGYSLGLQQQQQYVPPISAIPALPRPLPPQICIPPPPPPPSVPQAYFPLTLPPAPQAYIPPPSFPVMPSPDANLVSSLPQNSYNGYPSVCRACPPAPPPLNITVTGHCWIQHCSACHHVPTPESNPNVRPFGGRSTPLLRQPTVPQYLPEQTQQQYFHTNAPVMMRPWLRKTPPLPPGAVLISDEYINKNSANTQYDHSQRQHRQYQRGSRDKHRSTTVTSRPNPATTSTAVKNNRSMPPRRTNNTNNNNPIQNQESTKTSTPKGTTSSSSSSSGLSVEYSKVVLPLPNTKQNAIPQSLTREARNVNLQYKYQPEELPNVYLVNQYLKSSSEASTLSSNTGTSFNRSLPFIKEHSPTPSSSSSSSSIASSYSIKGESTFKKVDEKPPRPPSLSKKSKEKLIIIREFAASSPSTTSTISSDMSFSIINKDEDSLSTTSTLKTNNLEEEEEDDTPNRNIF